MSDLPELIDDLRERARYYATLSDLGLPPRESPAALEEVSAAPAADAGAGLKAVPTGIEHGTITVVTPQEPIEVTTLREDVETDGRHAVVRFGSDFAQDAARFFSSVEVVDTRWP